MINTENLIWTDLSDTHDIPDYVLHWIIDSNSLTNKLKQKYNNFTVTVLSQLKQTPHKNEISALGINKPAIVRTVKLSGNNKAIVFARSIIPISADTKYLLKIGSQPLGEILFNDPNITRDKLQVTKTDNVWGRRSIFLIGSSKLLVSEFFLKNLYA